MLVLGIETSCDDTGVALVEDGARIVAEATSRQDDLHARFGGVVPEVASRCHSERIAPLVDGILRESNLSYTDIDGIAYTQGPGLIGSLLVGLNFAKSLAYGLGITAIGIHHLEAHLYSTRFAASDCEDSVVFPHLALLVSGGHTSLYVVRSWTDFESMGETLDDAVGEAFDKVAKLLGLGYPGGPAIERAAREAQGPFPELPTPKTERPFDFSLSGLKSAVARIVQKGGYEPACVASAFQRVVAELLTSRVLDACAHANLKHVTLSGGVAANRALRGALESACADHGYVFTPAPLALAMDNGVMVAGAGYHRLASGERSPLDAGAFSTSRRSVS